MAIFDRFRNRRSARTTGPEPAAGPWDPADPAWVAVDWAGAGVPDDRVEVAVEIAASDCFGIDPCDEDGFAWTVAVYDDVRGLVGDPAIETLPGWLETFPDIDEVVHADRELLLVAGPVDGHTLAVRAVTRLATTADPGYWDDADT